MITRIHVSILLDTFRSKVCSGTIQFSTRSTFAWQVFWAAYLQPTCHHWNNNVLQLSSMVFYLHGCCEFCRTCSTTEYHIRIFAFPICILRRPLLYQEALFTVLRRDQVNATDIDQCFHTFAFQIALLNWFTFALYLTFPRTCHLQSSLDKLASW